MVNNQGVFRLLITRFSLCLIHYKSFFAHKQQCIVIMPIGMSLPQASEEDRKEEDAAAATRELLFSNQ